MKKKPPSIVVLATLTVITILTWIFYEVYQALTTPPSLEIQQEVLAPITPTLDSQSLDKLQQSVFFEDQEILPITLPTPTPIPLATPTEETSPTPSEEETPSPTPTPEGQGEEAE